MVTRNVIEQPSANQIVIGVDTLDLAHLTVGVDHLGRRLFSSRCSCSVSPSGGPKNSSALGSEHPNVAVGSARRRLRVEPVYPSARATRYQSLRRDAFVAGLHLLRDDRQHSIGFLVASRGLPWSAGLVSMARLTVLSVVLRARRRPVTTQLLIASMMFKSPLVVFNRACSAWAGETETSSLARHGGRPGWLRSTVTG
jgi:hypothetical protein